MFVDVDILHRVPSEVTYFPRENKGEYCSTCSFKEEKTSE